MTTTTLYLVRHGAVFSVDGKRYIGQTEAPLNERGVEQAWALRNWLEPVEFTRILCSDLTRSQRSARIIAGPRGIPIETRTELREICLGEWEGFSFHSISQRFPEAYEQRGKDLENWRPPGGESFADCRARVVPFVNSVLAASGGNILIVAHAGVNRLVLCDALGIPTQTLMSIGQDYGCLNIVEYSDDRCRLKLLNYAPLGTRPVLEAPSIDVRRAAANK